MIRGLVSATYAAIRERPLDEARDEFRGADADPAAGGAIGV